MEPTLLANLSDDELVNLAQQRNEAAFAELMRRTSSTSLKLALSILRDRQDAEDEVQNSYWNAWRYVDRFERESKFSTWISRIVTNQCLMRLRKSKRANLVSMEEGSAAGDAGRMEIVDQRATPETELGNKEVSAILHREIHRLPPLLRNVVLLRDIEELSVSEVAARLEITVAAAKTRLLRARLELRGRMQKHARRLRPAELTA